MIEGMEVRDLFVLTVLGYLFDCCFDWGGCGGDMIISDEEFRLGDGMERPRANCELDMP